MVDSRLGAIIGGSIAGGLVLIAFVAVVIYLCLKQRRRRKERDRKEFRPLSAHNSPTHSQPSTLGHAGNGVGVGVAGPLPPGLDPRLPKVGSNGLWLGTPGIYASSPSPAYFLGRPGPAGPVGGKLYQPHLQPYPHHGGVAPLAGVQRASSETRLPQGSRQGPPGPPYLSGGSHQRIYHSQQLSGLVPVYELVDPRTGNVYDVYQPDAGSRTQLLDGSGSHGKGGSHHNHHHHRSKSQEKVERSHSDAHNHRHHKVDKQQPGSGSRGSKTELLMGRAAEMKQEHDNRAFSLSTEKLPHVADKMPAVVTSATDSVKLLAKNRTDDQKTTVVPTKHDQDLELPADLDKPSLDVFYRQPSVASTHSSSPSAVVASVHQQQQQQQRKDSPPPVPEKTSTLHYTLDGDIYAVPEKERGRRRGSDNPILARMQDMSLDRDEEEKERKKEEEDDDDDEAERKGHRVRAAPVTDIYETAEPLLIRRVDEDVGRGGGGEDFLAHGNAPVLNPIYQELDEVVGQASEGGQGEVTPTRKEDLREDTSRHPYEDDPSDDPLYAQVAAVAGAVTSHEVAGASGEDDRPGDHSMDHRPSIDMDSAQGKQLSESETVRAFDFLDSYLSDDDDGVESIHSIPKSPALSGQEGRMSSLHL